MDNFEEEVRYFTDLVFKNIQEAKNRKKRKEETIFNCINVSKNGQSVVVFDMNKGYPYELLKKDIEEYNFKIYVTKHLALLYIERLIKYSNKEITFEELADIREETNPVVKNLIQQKDNIMDQLKLLSRNKDIPEVQEYIDKLYNDKFASKYVRYLIDTYYYGKKGLKRLEKNGLERMHKMLLS